MTEVIIDTDKRNKRRLPSWMHGYDALKNEKLGNLDEFMSNEADVMLAEQKINLDGKEILAKNCSKKNTRKSKKYDGSKDFSCKSKVKNVECGKSKDIQHMKLKSAKGNSEKVLSLGMTGDAVELTVEDLISIAEEFLTSDNEMQNESDSIPISSSKSSIPHRGEFKSSQMLSKCDRTRNSLPNHTTQKHTDESATFEIGSAAQWSTEPVPPISPGLESPNRPKNKSNFIGSGDPAQDMLELFLGPLLNKAPDVTRDLLTSTYEPDSLVRSFVDVEKHTNLMKKKSSLKDKVAMFF